MNSLSLDRVVRYSALIAFALATALASVGLANEPDGAGQASKTQRAAHAFREGRRYEVGRDGEKNLVDALRLYETAANLGHVEAQFSAGLLLLGAVPGSPHGPERAFRWFGLAAGNGHSMAAYFMAMSYEAGEGVEASSEQAFEWYRKSAQRGNGGAMNGLARMYAAGAGVRMDLPRAFAWNQTSGTRGHVGWKEFEAELMAKMDDQQRHRGERFAKSLIAKYGDLAVLEANR